MLSGVGIGQEIERKKEAYRGNPQALQKRYQQNKQLVDLLALQQLKSEKETAVRNMQAQMQQNPATIAQQREQEVLVLIHQGLSNKEIAERMSVAPATVKAHIRNLYGKLGVSRRTEALAKAREVGLLEDVAKT